MIETPTPYPADTRAKGWRFELDIERIKQSDTWALAALDVRPWLLMLWSESWGQVPCGSLPADDALIAARIGMAPKAFSKARSMLMRGWWLATDGRLYHDTIAARVVSMLEAKRKESDRKAAYRARMESERAGDASNPTQKAVAVPRDSHGTAADYRGSDPGSDATGTSTGTGTRRKEEEKEKPTRKRAAVPPSKPDEVSAQTWDDWLSLRRRKGAPVTPTVLSEATAEALKAGMTMERFLAVWCMRGSQGLQAEWLKPHERSDGLHAQSFRERDAANAIERVKQTGGGLVHAKTSPITRRNDALQEVFDAAPRLVG